jgi:hypothetical protein
MIHLGSGRFIIKKTTPNAAGQDRMAAAPIYTHCRKKKIVAIIQI